MKKKILITIVAIITLLAMLSLVGCAGGNNPNTEYDTIKMTKMTNYELLNQTAEKEQVVIIGDSIVELYPTYELYADKDKEVYNRGISGDTSDRLLERLDKNALNIAPSTLCILVGTNDIGRGISQDVTLDNISQCIDKAQTAQVSEIIIQSVYPVNYNVNKAMVGRRKNSDIIEFNKKLKTLCEEKNVVYADVFSILTDEDGNFNTDFTYDGLHPNAKGYIEITKVLSPIINW